MRGLAIATAVIGANWALAMYAADPGSSTWPDDSAMWLWSTYAVVALTVTGLVAAKHAFAGFWLAVPLVFFSVFSPWFVGLGMLPSSLAALALATRASLRVPQPRADGAAPPLRADRRRVGPPPLRKF